MSTKTITLSVVFSLCLVQFSLASITFSDGTFDSADWSITAVASDFAIGDVTVEQIGSGGNPGEFRKVTNYVETASREDRPWIFGFHEFNSAIYDPSLSGEITSLDFSIDFMNIDVVGNGHRFSLALEQDGHLYFAPLDIASEDILDTWQSISVPALVESDFTRVDPALGAIRDSPFQPDLSASGSPVVFGFYTFNSNRPGFSVGHSNTLTVGYDNWEVDLTVVPKPTIDIDLDIKPGPSNNTVSLNGNGTLQMAILANADFNVSEVNIASLLFGDPILVGGGATPLGATSDKLRDLNHDGLDDLLVGFSISDLVAGGALDASSVEGRLTGELLNGTPILGSDIIRMVPQNNNGVGSLVVAAVPEPGSCVLALAALCLTMSRRRIAAR